MSKIFNRPVKLGGEDRIIDSKKVRVLLYDRDNKVFLSTGKTAPTGSGYAKGGLFIKTDAADGTKALYENEGTTSVASFNAVGDIASSEITLAQGSFLVGNASGVSTALDVKGDAKIIVGNGTTATSVNVEGDITIDNAGAATIGSGKVVEGMIAAGAVTDTKTTGIVVAENLGEPDVADDNRFLLSVNMQATAYTLDETTLPADNPPRNITITHAAVGDADTLGDAVVTGTNVNDEVITETITVASGTVATGTKAFKTVTEVVTAGWVIDANQGTADTIEVGFGDVLGLSKVFSSADNIFIQTLDGVVVAGTVAVDATDVESNTIDISSGTYNGAKTAIVSFFN